MGKLSRLEIVCLAVTLLILTVMATAMITRKTFQQDPELPPSDTDLATGVSPASGSAGSGSDASPGGALSAPGDPDFSARARQLPNPTALPDERTAAALTGGASQTSNPTAKPPVLFGTNQVMLALQRLATMPWSPASEQLLQDTVTKWAASDPTAALQYALGIESRRVRASLVSGIFNSWAKTDPGGAYNWLMANRESDPGTFQMGLKPVFTALSAGGIDNAMKMALSISTGADRLSAMRIVVEQAARGGTAPSMVSYIDTLQTPGERQSYASMLAQNWALYAPEDAAKWALSLTDPALQKATLSTTIGAWASDNPQAAAAWALSLPAGELKNKQIAQVTQSWARYDPVRAADCLLAQHPPSPNLDPAIQGLVGTVVRSNPEGAIMWAATISDPKQRTSTIISASREWMRNDPNKASAYIMTAPLTPTQRTRLLQGR